MIIILLLISAEKVLANGIRLQTAENKVEAIRERLEHLTTGFHHSLRPPTSAKTTNVVPHMAPAPPKDPRTQRTGYRPGRSLHPAKSVPGAGKFLFFIEFY